MRYTSYAMDENAPKSRPGLADSIAGYVAEGALPDPNGARPVDQWVDPSVGAQPLGDDTVPRAEPPLVTGAEEPGGCASADDAPSVVWLSPGGMMGYDLNTGEKRYRHWGELKVGDRVFWQTDEAHEDSAVSDDEVRYVRADDKAALLDALERLGAEGGLL